MIIPTHDAVLALLGIVVGAIFGFIAGEWHGRGSL